MDTTTHHLHIDPPAVEATTRATATFGAMGEELAAGHLVHDDGLTVIARNWRLAGGELRGELDVVALHEPSGVVVVCEVKTRRDAARFGGALAAVGPRKRAKIRALTGAFLRDAGLGFRRVRLDVVAVDVGGGDVRGVTTLTHVQDAL